MNHTICPICEVEMTQDHQCSDYVFSSFSLELELLGLDSGIVPYSDYIEENPYSPYFTVQERNLTGFDRRTKPVPLFLRL